MEPIMRLALAGAVAFVVIAVAFLVTTLHRQRRNRAWAPPVDTLHPQDAPGAARFPLTFVLFTSPLCSDCQEIPGITMDAAPEVPLVTIDVQARPDAARRYAILETPTVLLVDERLRIRWAAVGLPDPEELWLYVREAWDSTTIATHRAARAHAAKG